MHPPEEERPLCVGCKRRQRHDSSFCTACYNDAIQHDPQGAVAFLVDHPLRFPAAYTSYMDLLPLDIRNKLYAMLHLGMKSEVARIQWKARAMCNFQSVFYSLNVYAMACKTQKPFFPINPVIKADHWQVPLGSAIERDGGFLMQ